MNEETKIEKIIEILKTYSTDVDNFNSAVFESDYENVAKEIVNMNKPICPDCNSKKIVKSNNICYGDYYCSKCSIYFNIEL